jgi:hypothetical protein
MGAYNTVRGQAICPNCGNLVEVVAQFKFGNVWQFEYELGDSLKWGGNAVGSPGLGHVVVDAIAETNCMSCGFSDEWNLYLYVKQDHLVELRTATGEHDLAREPDGFVVLDQ